MAQPSKGHVAKPEAASSLGETLAEIAIAPSVRKGREYVAFNDALEAVRAAYLAAATGDGDLVLVLIRR